MIRLLDCGVECTYTNNCITLTNIEHDKIDIINRKILYRIKNMIDDDWGYGTSCYGIYFGVDGGVVFFHDNCNNIVITKEDFLSIVNDVDKYNIFK